MRLNTILDTMLLAKVTSGTFGFLWSEDQSHALDQQTTSALTQVFTQGFIAQHRITNPGDLATAPVLTPVRSEAALAKVIEAAGPARLVGLDQPRDLSRFAPYLADRLDNDAYPVAFAALGFAPDIRRAIALAQGVQLGPNPVAIHLRGGDILHGTHAHHATYLHKAPSVLEIEALITGLTGAGRTVWLVGQEPDVITCMARLHPGVTTPATRPALGDVAQVIFDTVLMSRMQEIHGGNSGVTLLSRRLGGRAFFDLAKLPPVTPSVSWREDPLAAPAYAEVSVNMKAHSYVKVITASDPAAWTDLHLDLIGLARRWRPDSKFLGLAQVCVLAQLGQMRAAEAEARNLLASPLPAPILPEMGYAFLLEQGHFFPIRLTAPLAACDPGRHPALQVFAALRQILADPSARGTGIVAIGAALSALGSDAVDPKFRAMIDRCLQDSAQSPPS